MNKNRISYIKYENGLKSQSKKMTGSGDMSSSKFVIPSPAKEIIDRVKFNSVS